MPDSAKVPNRLIHEKSPYLLQHAYNPVDWYPWGEEAFAKAKAEDKPVFLSIGYSTCHWCHVMEEESFEDLEVARILKESFVAVKVDREERPDIDAVYMAVCQAVTGQGGWPMTLVLTPEQKPFFAATYLPKNSRYGVVGLVELLLEIESQWKTKKEELQKGAGEITAFLKEHAGRALGPEEPSQEMADEAVLWFSRHFDKQNGGFSPAPKFPSPHNLLFLLRCYELEQDGAALALAEKTLEQMYRGGLFDHVGGGFSRYSTDERWLIPHFEKMLYDNALLALAYGEAFRLTKKELYKRVAEATLAYVLREMTHEDGGFFTAQDADSGGVEGKYYLFTPDEIEKVLGKEEGETFNRWFGVTPSGNFEGMNLPNLLHNDAFYKADPEIERLCTRLYSYRRDRVPLSTDDKILTGQNGLMIAALARLSQILGEPKYLAAAKEAQRFLASRLQDQKGRLLTRWRDGEAKGTGHLDDYAFTCWGLLELYAATLEAYYLAEGVRLAELMARLFFDEGQGGFYLEASDGENLIFRPKELYDGASPSGNSVAALVLIRLFRLTGDSKWQKYKERQIGFLAGNTGDYPAGRSFFLLALLEDLYPSRELVCVASGNQEAEPVLAFLRKSSPAGISVLFKTADNEALLKTIAPFTADYPVADTGAAYYLCQGGACAPPVYGHEGLQEIFGS